MSPLKQLEDILHAHLVSLVFNLITSAKDSDDLSIGFDRNRGGKHRELTDNKHVFGNHHLRFMLKDVFAFAGHQQKATFGLG